MYSLRSFRRSAGASAPVLLRRSLQTSAARLASKESAHGNENRAQEAEKVKQDQLKAQKEGRNEWRDELASDSESAVKADQDGKSIDQMQKEGAQKAEKQK